MHKISDLLEKAYSEYSMIQKPNEILELARDYLFHRKAKIYIEIGTQKGGTLYFLTHFFDKDCICISIDNTIPPNREFLKFEPYDNNPTFHFILGDSHTPSVKQKLRTILDGKQADILFIDGDHSYKGVKQDYYEYKEFVKDGGEIIFHDIIDSEFHRACGCEVNKFWREVKGSKVAILDKNYTIQPITKAEIGQWGGIGTLHNEKVEYQIYQIYFARVAMQYFKIKQAIQYENKQLTPFYENDLIMKLCEEVKKETNNKKYYGTVSWRFFEKTKFTSETLEQGIQGTNNQYDVIFMPPYYNRNETDFYERNKKQFTGLYQLTEAIDKLEILPFKFATGEWTNTYANYWIARKQTYIHYCDTTLKSIYEIFKMPEIREICEKNTINRYGKSVKLYPFLMEVLMGYHVNHYKIRHTRIFYDGTK